MKGLSRDLEKMLTMVSIVRRLVRELGKPVAGRSGLAVVLKIGGFGDDIATFALAMASRD